MMQKSLLQSINTQPTDVVTYILFAINLSDPFEGEEGRDTNLPTPGGGGRNQLKHLNRIHQSQWPFEGEEGRDTNISALEGGVEINLNPGVESLILSSPLRGMKVEIQISQL